MIEYELIQQRLRELQARAERERQVREAAEANADRRARRVGPQGLRGRLAAAARRGATAGPGPARLARTAPAEGC
ncbi:hypothetical protein [Kitasatospora sp. NPDC057015]|uniref:hypothetical protein n=1 Tax=Kitasatospora sp. NPDC057015 TaxID=3346001 RepID=UPI0036373B04